MPRVKPPVIPPKPPAMTWRKATPALVVAIVFDLLRAFFSLFWFFGPALAFMYCSWKAGQYVGSGAAQLVCSAGAGLLGVGGFTILAPFGVVMAMATGFIGFLLLGTVVFITNRRLFRDDAFSIVEIIGGFALSEVPLLDALPIFTTLIWRLYHQQIKKDAKKLQAWKIQSADAIAARNKQIALQARQMQLAQLQAIQAQEAANDAYGAQEEAANDAVYTQEEAQEAETDRNTYTQEIKKAA